MNEELRKQNTYVWERTKQFNNYGEILGYYQVASVLEKCKDGDLLDLACGDGFNTKIFSQYFENVVGVDASSMHLKKAKLNVPNATFVEGLIEEVELEQKFDCVTMLNVLEHVQDPILTLQRAASFLKDEGYLFVHVPNCDAINRKIAVKMGTLLSCDELTPFDLEIVGHRRSYNLESLKQEIADAGLTVVETGGVFYKMFSYAQMDWILEKGLWEEGGYGWGRSDMKKDWKAEFCRACYEIGKERPEDCNIIFAVVKK